MLYNKNIRSLENIVSTLNDAMIAADIAGETDLYYQIGNILDTVNDQLKTVRLDCQSKTLACCEKLDDIVGKVWSTLDSNKVEVWEPVTFRVFFDEAAKDLETVCRDYIRMGADEDFLYNRLYQALLELDKASEDIEMPPATGNLFSDLDDDFPF